MGAAPLLPPAPPKMADALDLYFRATGFSPANYTAPSFVVRLLGVPVRLPSTAARKRALPLHDLHHILTGFRTDWPGEAEVSAWELRAGCDSLFLYWINTGGVLVGLLVAPRRVWRAFRAARGQHSLYRDSLPYTSLLEMDVVALRRRLGIPDQGLG